MSIMPKDLKDRELPKGIYQKKDGRYGAGMLINGIRIQLYDFTKFQRLRKTVKDSCIS